MFWRLLKTSIAVGLSCLCVIALQLVVSSVFPRPGNMLNVLVVVLMLILVVRERGHIVWYGFLLFFLLDSYGAGTPFGIVLFSGVSATLCAYWLYERIFTNRSWYAAGAITALLLVVFRVLYSIILFLVLALTSGSVAATQLVRAFAFELLFTTVLVMVLVFVMQKIVPSLRFESRKSVFMSLPRRI